MFASKSTLFFSFLALCNFVAAETPGCLLSAVGNQSDPSDLASLCGPQSGKLQTLITKKCDDTAQVAMQAYSSICSSAGHKVVITSSKAESTTESKTASASGTGAASTGFVTKTSSATATGSSTSQSGSSSTSSSSTSSGTSSSGSSSPVASGAASASEVGSAASFAAAVFLGFAAML
ncbi:hypothetical protein DTO166G4_2584 [Paecilomyces variotii]|uniref:GPI anchored cell wall protein n=1 Tax=Byssochlamys spectabilis TaxID=264951 RepID=A0A443HZZ4_BYSSP|nr:hypothetical protein C8Q69DRAFT_134111 [Paecilomyces variotii]KAJ9196987.1 hypothetical protein DTO164E3_5956 [Paecilomyces variotii]KAJ9197839.1 hypothetical protein DTO032I3_5796 [Paecilomyces variotii]KAJ9215747.1 hypothetical protein DTO166G4_2584 [Paecilomyces variotii]KAJ9240368.1 hypothetical protein DTO166G5_1706 [Paecilomyces variotii]KAJ9243712.1 hypothetical protein DTO169E5_2341 [Paecilomyces variotii]